MILNAMYFGKSEIYDVIRKVGGTWNDNKERPIVCLLRVDNTDVYWAIPVGNWNHRDKNPNYFRQHITDVKKYLLNELK
jgi:hypothetical protein